MSTKLFINKICPFAQRAMIAAAHKNFKAEQVEISLSDMPEWYKKEINPREQVPAIQFADGTSLSESALIAQYIDSVTEPKNALFPANAEIRRQIRAFNTIAEPAQWASYAVIWAKPDELEGKINAARVAMSKVEQALSKTSSFAVGSTFTMADVNFVPFVIRFAATLKAYAGWDLLKEFPRIQAFRDQCLTIPAVATTTPPAEYFISAYAGYAGDKKNTWQYHLYRAVGCPYCERVELTWAQVSKGAKAPSYLKDQSYLTEEVVGLGSKMPDIYKKFVNPDEEVPVLRLPNGTLITSSEQAATYFAEQFEEAGLIPASEEKTLAGRWYVDAVTRVFGEIGSHIMARTKDFEFPAEALTELKLAEKTFAASGPAGKPYLFGDEPSLYDFLTLPFFHRAYVLLGNKLTEVAPSIAKSVEAARKDSVFGSRLMDAEEYLKQQH